MEVTPREQTHLLAHKFQTNAFKKEINYWLDQSIGCMKQPLL
jgi:hypothetical protein